MDKMNVEKVLFVVCQIVYCFSAHNSRELAIVREQEKAQKKAAQMKYNSRHSRFGGTYVVANMKSISERDVIFHNSVSKVKDMTFDQNKVSLTFYKLL